ncbi:chemotaxis protein CheX|uniref:Chemotaxis phosphatase CheX n=1 Tax=Dendrosporobacter quercicolus TaxID=146817 RepID=A0A1G9NYZ8_9FIRM|nr:chemotaxis protein CheX [Dendrosporobacter quercicolus]NSL47489.1 chemotaxis protein CheX [Dendrosporobacter quercicolus DSM 1736]SDL91620.1 Chemotaxis phosphatase CheX [Dendrosporobacter quercicolus]
MISQFLAQYILNQGLLAPEQIREALESRRAVRPKLGVLAIDQGFLTAVQVEEIHRLQHTVDKRFGEIALDKGYLSVEQLAALLAAQENEQLNFGQILVERGFMSFKQLEQALAGYKRGNTLQQHADMPLLQEHIRSCLTIYSHEDAELYTAYVALFLRSIVRFLDVVPLVVEPARRQSGEQWFVSQDLTGDFALQSSFTAEDHVLLELARRYSGESIDELDALALDSAGEFLNVANGLFCINLANRGLNIELQPPAAAKGAALAENAQPALVIETGFGRIMLLLAGK